VFDSATIATSLTYLKPHAMPILPCLYVPYNNISSTLNNKNRISEIGDPYRIPVGVGKLSDRYPSSLMRVLLLLRNNTVYSTN
jgi:hypothetical protein